MRITKCVVQRLSDRLREAADGENALVIGNREAASDVYGAECDACTTKCSKKSSRFVQWLFPLSGVGLLRSDMERHTDRTQSKIASQQEQLRGHLQVTTKFS